MQTVTFLIGIPCSGKSTYRNKYHKEAFVISRDDIRESLVDELLQAGFEFEYGDFFVKPKSGESEHPRLGTAREGEFDLVVEANRRMDLRYEMQVEQAGLLLSHGVDVVVDLLNLTSEEREPLISALSVGDNKVEFDAVVFEYKDNMDKIERLNAKRSELGKVIPFSVIKKFAESLELPCPIKEPFKKVIHVNGLA